MIIPTSVLATIKTRQITRLIDKGEIHRPVKTATASGGTTLVWTPIGTNLSIGVAEGPGGQSAYERLIIERFAPIPIFFILLVAGQDIKEKDRIYQTVPITRTFEVVSIPNKNVSFETLRRVIGIELI